ncbi:MAG TPA: Flp pilus assembly complex ATPase component TadA [Candidatus Blautia merdigallinarum]|uniref:Flp pilus assembly complex ATPase component TadA n=1 Tax=Candidatus Blautia merdigallinarum TaxID=2838495 RepID=A0A9D2SMB9_9FIRM|nr:Flp pilus assembly complex ATPase component TadA [Candidatus Blautia merdigallinarum]
MDKSQALLGRLRTQLASDLENTWEVSDEEVLEIIDRLLLNESKTSYLSLSRLEELRMELFRSLRKMDVLEELLENDSITEIMVNRWDQIFIEQEGQLSPWKKTFSSPEKLEDVISQIASRCNRVINTLQPVVDAHLPGGERVHAVIPPVALDGPVLTIRKFPREPITMKKLLDLGSLTPEAAAFLQKAVEAGYTILIGGGTGSGKTTFLNALSQYIPQDQRVITIEDNAELQIQGIPNLIRLECRQANIEKSQEITIADLLKACLRMRPSRIIVGEVRSGEAAQLLQAVNVGNDGSLSTIHANTCQDMVSRLETMVLMGIQLPIPVIRRQIVSGFDLFIHLGRMKDKSRKVLEIAEIEGMNGEEVRLNPLFIRDDELKKVGKMLHREKFRKAGILYDKEL